MHDKDDLRLLYQVLSSQIEFSKSQQWTISYYSLLFIGGLVGFSELIYNEFAATIWGKIALSVLAVAALPVAMASFQVIWKNEKSMCKNRKHYQKMWSYLSWPFNDGDEGQRLVGKGAVYASPIYARPMYDRIFWFPPVLLTWLASVISCAYLVVRFLKIEKIPRPWQILLFLNLLAAIVLSLVIRSIYRRWDEILERKTQKKGPKGNSLSSIIRRIRLLIRWIYTGQIPPCTCSCPHALLIKWICKG